MFGLPGFDLPKFGDGIGLHRMARFFALHGIDTELMSQRSIVVTGSNGKGSTARFTTAALESCGLATGCFTSPHLFDVRERFMLGDAIISPEAFSRHAATATAFNDALGDGDRIGAFEFLFLVAVLWFEETNPDVIVWEAGIGGRLDPVRALRARVSALTSVEIEHAQLLGSTQELIAYDKIDALAPGGTLIVSPSVDPALHDRIGAYADLLRRRVVMAGGGVRKVSNHPGGVTFDLTPGQGASAAKPFALAMIGAHQIDNAITATHLAAEWLNTHAPGAPTHLHVELLRRLETVVWPGRLERVARNPDLWIDVGHTPHALDVVTSAWLDFTPRERTLVVFGVSGSKDVDAIARLVAARFDHFVLTRANKAGAHPSVFRDHFPPNDVVVAPDIREAAAAARTRADAEGLSVLAIGGLFLAVEFAHAWRGGDPAVLDFL